jgi:hypothetical protein
VPWREATAGRDRPTVEVGTLRLDGRQLLQIGLGLVAAMLLALLLDQGVTSGGPAVLLLPPAAVGAAYLLVHPGQALGVLVATTILFEESDEALFDRPTDWFYAYVGPVQLTDVLLAIVLVSIPVSGLVRRSGDLPEVRVRDLGAFDLPLGLLAVAVALGFVTGAFGAADQAQLLIQTKTLAYLLVVPFVTAWILQDARQRRAAVRLVGGLVVFKCGIALVAYAVGQGYPDGNGGQLTYYEAPMNQLSVLYLLTVAASPFARVRLPRWMLLGAPVVGLCLALSLRRSFWIGVVLALLLLLIVASGQRGRPWLAVGAISIALAVWTMTVAGGSTDTTNPVLQRAETINPTDLRSNSTDRYRLEEQANIIEELRRHPATGIGLGVPWVARSPLSEEHVGGRSYTHTIVLWYWLKLGPLGLVAYAWLTGLVIWSGFQVWRRSARGLERCVGLAYAAGTVGLVVVELTGSFSGAGFRFTALLAVLVGWLASATLDLPEEHGAEQGSEGGPALADSRDPRGVEVASSVAPPFAGA